MKQIKVEIWSDVVCPWCYIGKRRFETALARFEQRDQVEIQWRSYQLDPHAPSISTEPLNEMLTKKYGMSLKQASDANTQVSALAAAEGLTYHLEKARPANTFDAHRLIHLAASHRLQGVMKERLLQAYFSEGASIGDSDVLVKEAVTVGIDADEARSILDSDTYANEVRADEQRARDFGVSGVPFFAIEEKYGISGAQPSEVFLEALERVWSE